MQPLFYFMPRKWHYQVWAVLGVKDGLLSSAACNAQGYCVIVRVGLFFWKLLLMATGTCVCKGRLLGGVEGYRTVWLHNATSLH